jgi:hypothetical protein
MASTEIRDRRRTLRYRNLVLKQMVQMKNRVSGLLKPRDMKPRDEKYPMLGSPLPFTIGLLFICPAPPTAPPQPLAGSDHQTGAFASAARSPNGGGSVCPRRSPVCAPWRADGWDATRVFQPSRTPNLVQVLRNN